MKKKLVSILGIVFCGIMLRNGIWAFETPTLYESENEIVSKIESCQLGKRNNLDAEYSATSIMKDTCTYSEGGSVFSKTIWNSLSAARTYYGTDYTYSSCNMIHGGIRYNYCFSFSDNSKCYFRVSK